MPAHEIEAIEAALDQHVNYCKPKILKGAPACVHGRGKRGTMCADTVGHDRERTAARRQFINCAFCYSFNNDVVCREGQVIPMLFRMPNWNQYDFTAFGIRR